MSRVSLAPVARLAGLRAYRPPAADPRIDLRLDANEGPRPPEGLIEALRSLPADRVRRYPSVASLEALLAERAGVDAACVVVTAGGDDALGRLAHAYLEPGRSAVCAVPTFEMIPLYASMTGAEFRTTEWWTGAFPTEAIVGSITEDTSLVFLVTPNNPTGLSIGESAVREISRAAGEGALVVLDLAYTEFADQDLTDLVRALPNVVAVRTFSKAWGLAGLRVGYAVGPEPVIETLRAAGHPYAVSGASLEVAEAAVRLGPDRCGVTDSIARVRRERETLASLFDELVPGPTPCIAGDANFVLARLDDSAGFHESLACAGIAVRAWPTRPGFEHLVRITCPGDDAGFARLVTAIRSSLETNR